MFKKLIVVNQMNRYDDLVFKFANSLKFLGVKECIIANNVASKSDAKVISYEDENLNKALELFKESDIRTEVKDLSNLPIDEINALVRGDDDFDNLIVIGAKVSSIGKRIFDSEFAYELIQMPSKPILIVRIHEVQEDVFETIPKDGLHEFSNVLFPTDFSENAYHAFNYLEKMVESGLKKVTLMHVQDIAKISPYLDYRILEFNQIDRDRLDGLKKRLELKGDVQVEVILDVGRPFKEITQVIEKNGIDLVIMGRQGKGFLKDIFIGSTSNNITRRANASVLLIPRKEG
jgi:nucleotide-binding universal stress UspA family protein